MSRRPDAPEGGDGEEGNWAGEEPVTADRLMETGDAVADALMPFPTA